MFPCQKCRCTLDLPWRTLGRKEFATLVPARFKTYKAGLVWLGRKAGRAPRRTTMDPSPGPGDDTQRNRQPSISPLENPDFGRGHDIALPQDDSRGGSAESQEPAAAAVRVIDHSGDASAIETLNNRRVFFAVACRIA